MCVLELYQVCIYAIYYVHDYISVYTEDVRKVGVARCIVLHDIVSQMVYISIQLTIIVCKAT